MNESVSVHPSVVVDAALLKEDRENSGFTQLSFSAECESVSLATVRRAEQGHKIIKSSLSRMATVLGHSAERYILDAPIPVDNKTVPILVGEWTGFFVEDDHGTQPYITIEAITIRQNGRHIEGELLTTTLSKERAEKFVDCKIVDNVLSGSLIIETPTQPAVRSMFIQTLSRNNDWLDGYCSWLDPVSDIIESSRMLSVRKNSPFYDRFLEEAQSAIERELFLFRLRKLLEAGYLTDDAITMLSSIDLTPSSATPSTPSAMVATSGR